MPTGILTQLDWLIEQIDSGKIWGNTVLKQFHDGWIIGIPDVFVSREPASLLLPAAIQTLKWDMAKVCG